MATGKKTKAAYNQVPVGALSFHEKGPKPGIGYWYIKVNDYPELPQYARWEPLATYVFEKLQGRKLEPYEQVTFLDGNHSNFAYNNLVLINKSVNGTLTAHRLRSTNSTVGRVGVAVAKLHSKLAAQNV